MLTPEKLSLVGGTQQRRKFFLVFPRGRKNTPGFAFRQQHGRVLVIRDWSSKQLARLEWQYFEFPCT